MKKIEKELRDLIEKIWNRMEKKGGEKRWKKR